MFRKLVFYIFLAVLFTKLDCEVYQDRPKIKTSDGDLILEPAYNKHIILKPNGPKSNVYVGELNILDSRSKSSVIQNLPASNDDFQELLNGPSGLLQRLEKLESKTYPVPDDLFLNISLLWRKVNNLQRKVHSLQTQINNRGSDECQAQPCQHGGTCLNLVNGYHCLCPSNWEGKDCDIDVNECRNFAGTELGCQNGATCINKPGSYECLCRSGWFGLHCTARAKDCLQGNSEMCGHGTCLKVDTGEGITCICNQGWTKNETGVACLTDINECDSHQGTRCSVNPKVDCINLPGSFQCGPCPSGYEGDGYNCADIDECITIPNGGCSPVVACHNTIGSRICGPCPSGFQGDGVTCLWRGRCSINHGGCHPSAQCVDSISLSQSAQCLCPEGMDGDGVGVHGCYMSTGNNLTESCANNPCGAHGQCHPLRLGYTCICQKGYAGSHCDVLSDLCTINPCRNGGICRIDDSTATGFRCECTAQFSGSLCQVPSKICGGVLDAEEGNIVYPLTNTTYTHNSRCAWVIHTVPNKVINVTFIKFSLEDDTLCNFDFLQIHDGRSSASQLIGRFCGSVFPKGGNIISSHNNIYFWFRSDSTVAKYGFALHWTSIDPVCGGEIDVKTHGHIESPGSPGTYPPNRDCYWQLTSAFGKKIQLHFFALDIEKHSNCSFDYLAIYDGRRESDPLLNKYCNATQPAPLLSAGSDLLIHFHSDAYGFGKGFQISYAPVPGVPGCGGYFTADQGELTAPSFNGTYLNNLICEYQIKTSPDTKIRIDFKQFHLESSLRCRFDHLKIYDGPSEESPLVGKFCGTTYPMSYVSSSNMLFFRFRSDITVSNEGFKIHYRALCQHKLHGDSGIIKSPGYPFSYPENKVCEYVISASPGKAIQLTFQDFDIEDNRYYDCRYDHVEIRDGPNANSTLLGKYCGGSDHIPPTQLSTHNYMFIRFNSDMSVSGTGFYANYTTIDTECGGIYKETTGLINHPSGESTSYKNDQSCSWILFAPQGMHIKLTWHRFEIENMPSCYSDYLELIEIDDDNGESNMGKFCGNKSPPAFTTSTNRLKMVFHSDNSVRSSGFSVSYTFLDEKSHCGGMYYRSHGIIYSPGWPSRYEPHRDCTWVITVPMGQQIKLNMSRFELERPIRGTCNYGDYLELRNGATQNSPLIGRYCGKFQTKFITSLANTIHIHFHSDNYISGSGFALEWDGTIIGCGGTLTSSSGSISSPNYPDSYNENTECFYRIATSLGSRIRLSFVDLELENTPNCRDDYVEIFDGRDSDANSLGKHCVMLPGINNVETTGNYAYIKFRSDSYIGGKGFLLNYFTLCNNNLTGRHGVIESPNYPNSYPFRLDCIWSINVLNGNRINATFTHFDVHKRPYYYSIRYHRLMTVNSQANMKNNSNNCEPDFLQWKEAKESKYSDKLCGTTPPPKISTKTNSLQIKFLTGGFNANTGFRMEWISYGCGGHIQKRTGSISVDSKTFSSNELDCEWLIETPVGTSVSLYIIDIFLSKSQNDTIEIYNGQNTNSPLITNECLPKSTVQSTANFMLIKFIKRSSLKGAYFTSSFNSYKSTCGGSINSLSGYIYSKNYPRNYDHNLDCTWVISVPFNYRIELNFMDLDLYSNEHVCDDSIKIYDEVFWTRKNYTSIICPRSNIRQIVTKHNRVMVQFTSDASGEAKGFKANFTVTCGAYITALNDGIISNEHYLGGTNKSCVWTISAAELDKKISLTITHLFLPKYSEINSNRSCGSSYLRVYDGDNVDAPIIDEYCGTKSPPMIVSRGSAITVLLGTYINNIVGHFSAHYSSLNEACGGTLTSEEGTIASPNYPRSYPSGANCEWTISTSPGNKVYVTFEQFDIEYSEGCNEDYLEIRIDNGGGQILGVYCGSDIPTNTTAATKLYIKFHSNDKNSGQGFLLHYGFVHGNDLINMEKGEIASPLYPHLYHGAATYTWRIQSSGSDTINIIIDNVEIPSYGNICNNYLSVYDGYDDTAPRLSELCGKLLLPEVLQTSSNMAYIKLSLDNSNTGSMFHLRWNKKEYDSIDEDDKVNCGSNYTEIIPPGNFSMFNSPHYPENYDSDLFCEWSFQATSGRHLRLNFYDFNLEETSNCFADYVQVYSADTLGQWKLVKEKMCETQTAMQVTNSSNYMKIKFKTDASVVKKGFRGKVSSICGGYITELSGEVGPTWDDARVLINRYLKCEWTIKVRPGRVIDLRFTHFNITNKNEKCDTYVTIRNGDSIEAPYLGNGKYCGDPHEKREEFTTSSNSLHISYTSNLGIYNRFNGTFKIRYEEKNIECGGTSRLDNGGQEWEVISTPRYPDTPLPFSECIWTFTAPPGEVLRVDFIDRFDLYESIDCVSEFVEIRDGSSNLAPLLLRECSEKQGTVKSTGNAMFIRYLTQLSQPNDGFKANVSIDICGGTIIAETGEIKSPGYPHMTPLPYGTNCEWLIKGRPSHVFTVTPQDIDLPESEATCDTTVTVAERIPGNESLVILRDFCENADKTSVETSSNEIRVQFKFGKPSEWSQGLQSRGFRLSFDSSKPTCGGSITTPEGYFTTPGFPQETSLRFCNWQIHVPDETRRIRLEIIDAGIEKHSIGIYNDNLYYSAVEKLDGNNTLAKVYESSGPKMAIILWLNSRFSKHRFKAKFSSYDEALCGGYLTGLTGKHSLNLDRSFTCEWRYNSEDNNNDFEYNTIFVTASVNSSVPKSRCRRTDPQLQFIATISKQLFVLPFKQTLCGTTQSTFSIPSSAMHLKATKSNDSSFDIQFEWKAQPCGGVVEVGEDPVNILKIPNNFNDTLHCAWVIVMPYNSRLQFSLEGSFQFSCIDEIIKIGQGISQYSTTIGQYCREQLLIVPLVTNFRYTYIQYYTKFANSSIKLIAKKMKSQCGGELTHYFQTFSSPNYPKSYEPNQECSWLITTKLGYRISLSFIGRFVVEDRPNCTKDAVIIFDWKDNDYYEIDKICGRQLPKPYNSTNNKMKVVLRTDATTNMDGFKASWKPICGGNFFATDKLQMLYSPGFPSDYPSMSNCTYTISAPNDKNIVMKFIEFELEDGYPNCEFDNVTIYGEDSSRYNYFYESYCGSNIPSSITNFNKLTIVFKSDRYVQRRGFLISYEYFNCGGQVVKEPTLLSSHHGDEYNANMNCTWLIEAPADKLIVLKFWYIDLESNYNCFNDYVAVYDDLFIKDDKRLALMCGHVNSTTVVRSTSNKIILQFVSDGSYNYKGFKVNVLFTYSESVGCGGSIDLTTSSEKILKSPLINNSIVYESYLDCQWSIRSPTDTIIKIEFTSFHISSCENVNQTAVGFSKCDCDLVEIKDGLNPDSLVIGTYCGHTFPPELHSSGNLMSLRLSTDGELNSSGFEVKLTVEQSICGQSRFKIGESPTRVKSPGYDKGTIPKGIHCIYYLDASDHPDRPVRLSILNLDLQMPYDLNGIKTCNKDKLVVTNHVSQNMSLGRDYIVNHQSDQFISTNYYYMEEEKLLPHQMEFCGSVKSSDLFVVGSMSLTLITSPDLDSTHKGIEFEVVFTEFCGRNFTGTQGHIKTYPPTSYSENTPSDCYTLITAPENHTISAYFITVIQDFWNENVYLDIFDGNDTLSHKLVSVKTDYDSTAPVFSTGRFMLLHNHAVGSDYVSYNMNFVTTDKGVGCGGKLMTELGRITSPNYPNQYREISTCEWELETPLGTRLKLHFEIFDLGRICDQNYLQLKDRKGNVISSYCSEKPADYTSTDNFVKVVFYTTMNNGGTGWMADFIGVI